MIDKPSGMTSHDVVAVCRRRLGVRRVGHAGTLDPTATGVLVIGVGRGARLLRFIEAHEKEYLAEIVLGAETSTDDAAGSPTATYGAGGVTRAKAEAAIRPFLGEIEQVPPAVSAIKVGGEALYRKVRRGEEVHPAPRRVTIHEIAVEAFEPGERARLCVRVRCSRGTYVRALARDLGRALGVGGHVGELRRTAVGPFRVEEAVALDAVSPDALRPMEDAVTGYPRLMVEETGARAISQGRPLPASGIEGPFAILGPSGLVAMGEDRGGETRCLCVVGDA